MDREQLPDDLKSFIDRGLIDLRMANELTTLREISADNVVHIRYGAKGELLTPTARLKLQKERISQYRSVPGCCCEPRMNYASRGLPDAWEKHRKARKGPAVKTEEPNKDLNF